MPVPLVVVVSLTLSAISSDMCYILTMRNLIVIILLMLSWSAWPQNVRVEKYDNGADEIGYRYQMDIGIWNATPSQVGALPSNPYVSMSWQSIGVNVWRGSEPGKNCEVWVVRDDDIGILCYSSSPF